MDRAEKASLRLEDSHREDLKEFFEMERLPHAVGFVGAYSLERHSEEFANSSNCYKSIYRADNQLAGFVILALDPDGDSLEFRRIVAATPGNGIGSFVLGLLPDICREYGRNRIWLDVYENNVRARSVYERAGFTQFGSTVRGDRTLLLYHQFVE